MAVLAKTIIWLLWAMILVAMCLYQLFLAPSSAGTSPLLAVFPLAMLLVPAGASIGVRWLLIPKWPHPLVTMILAVFGIVCADAISLFGIFLFPGHRLLYFAVGLLCLFQFAPLGLFCRDRA